MPITIHCRHCNGTGKEPLPPHLSQAIEMLRRLGCATAAECAAEAQQHGYPIGATGWNNRLRELWQRDFAQKVRQDGKTWRYHLREEYRAFLSCRKGAKDTCIGCSTLREKPGEQA